MNKNSTSPNYTKILNVLYIIVSLVVMTIFFFVSTPKADEYIGLNSVALWGTILASLIAVALTVSILLRPKK